MAGFRRIPDTEPDIRSIPSKNFLGYGGCLIFGLFLQSSISESFFSSIHWISKELIFFQNVKVYVHCSDFHRTFNLYNFSVGQIAKFYPRKVELDQYEHLYLTSIENRMKKGFLYQSFERNSKIKFFMQKTMKFNQLLE